MKNLLFLISILISTTTFAQNQDQCYIYDEDWNPIQQLDSVPPYFTETVEPVVYIYNCIDPVIEELEAYDTDGTPATISWMISPVLLCYDCNIGSSYILTYIAIDQCGNSTEMTTLVNVNDTTPPFIGTPAQDAVVNCDPGYNYLEFEAWTNDFGGMVTYDNCSQTTQSWEIIEQDSICDFYNATVRFISTDNCGNVMSDTATFTISLSLDVEDSEPENELYIYPNPTSGQFKLSQNVPYKIYNTTGEVVDSEAILIPGMYYVRTENKILKLIITQ